LEQRSADRGVGALLAAPNPRLGGMPTLAWAWVRLHHAHCYGFQWSPAYMSTLRVDMPPSLPTSIITTWPPGKGAYTSNLTHNVVK